MHKIIFFLKKKIIKKKYLCLPYLKFSDPLPDTHLFFLFSLMINYLCFTGLKLEGDLEENNLPDLAHFSVFSTEELFFHREHREINHADQNLSISD